MGLLEALDIRWLALALAADVFTTLYVLRRGGREANPAMRWLMGRLGDVAALVSSHVAVFALLWFMTQRGHVEGWTTGALTLFYALVSAWNVSVAYRLRSTRGA